MTPFTEICADYWISIAYQFAQKSQDPSTQVGAVVVPELGKYPVGENTRTISFGAGFNHFPPGTPGDLWADREQKLKHVIHAERHALSNRPSFLTPRSCIMYGTWACCKRCANDIIESGVVRKLVADGAPIDRNPSWKDEIFEAYDLLRENNIEVVLHEYDGPRGIRFGGKFWE